MQEALCTWFISTVIITQLVSTSILIWGVYDYIRLRRWLAKYIHIYKATILKSMDVDEIIDQLLDAPVLPKTAMSETVSLTSEQPTVEQHPAGCLTQQQKRDRLAALAAGGQARQHLGKDLTADQVDSMGDADIEKLYTRYEARLGAAMTKTLGQAALQLYSVVASMFLPIPPGNQPKLVADLEADPFVNHALSNATCELYHRYGMYLAPLTTVLTTAKYCQFGQTCPSTISVQQGCGGIDDVGDSHVRESDCNTRGDVESGDTTGTATGNYE